MTFRRVVVPLRGPGQSPVLPFACCIGSLLSVGRCGRCSCWCRFRVRGALWSVCWCCAVCASAATSSWRTGVVLVVAGVVLLFLLSIHLCPQAVHNLPRCVSVCVRPKCLAPQRIPAIHHIRSPTLWVVRVQGTFLVRWRGWRARLHGVPGDLRCTVTAPSSLVLPTRVLSEVPSVAWPTIPFHRAPQGPQRCPPPPSLLTL